MKDNDKEEFPAQTQHEQPGRESKMTPQPEIIRDNYKGSDKLKDKTCLITGGDSGIGRATAIHFAKEGADVAIVYLEEGRDAAETKKMVEAAGRKCMLIKGDLRKEEFCKAAIEETVKAFGSLNILVNNAAEQHPRENLEDISAEQVEKTFQTNIFSIIYLCREAMRHLKKGDCIINNTSVTAYRGSYHLLDYSATKGAITAFTRSLSQNLAKDGIRVNGVAPGPIWTPLIPATFDAETVKKFGSNTPMGRAGQPSEVAPCFVFLASEDASYMTGQILHPNGGEMVGS